MPAQTRKTDRRTLYTRQVVKDALLELLEKNPYAKINVTMLCKQAEITRRNERITTDCRRKSPGLPSICITRTWTKCWTR